MSPSGLFRNYTDAELAAVEAKIKDWMLNGQFISTSGSGKSGNKQFMGIERMQIEYNAEIRRRSGTPRVSSVQYSVGGRL